MSFAEKGAVGDIHPALFIGYLYGQKATGTLKFEEGPVQRAIYFREGRVLFSSSNAPEDQLGAILVAAGKIPQDKFDQIVASLEPKQSIAAALSQGGHVSQRDIGDAARRKVEQIIGSCCAQTVGQYEFEDGVLPKGALDLKLTTEKVLVSAFEVLEPSGFLIRILKSPMAVLARAAAEPADAELVRMRDALDGVSSLADVGGTLGLPLAATEARAAVLVVIGAASVVTSQIEEMALPDTGEGVPEMSVSDVPEDSEPVEAETIAFGQASGIGETIGFGEAMASPEAETESESAPPPSPPPASPDDTIDQGTGSGMAGVISPPPRPAPAPKAQRATTQDLDAVKELLGSPAKGAPARPGVASIPSKRWEPVLSSQGRPGRERAGKDSSIVKTVIAVVLFAGVAIAGWLAYLAQSGPAPQSAAAPAATPSATPVAAADPLASGSVPSASATPAAAVAPPPSGGKPLPSPPVASKPPSAAAPTPAPRATEKPAVAPKATPAPATSAPAVSRAGASGGAEALKAGRLADAAAAFEAVAQTHSADFSVQLLVACSPATIEKAVQNDPSSDLFILPATIAGKPCHRLMRGFFKTTAEATQAVATLPPYYTAEGAKPKAIPVKSVLR